MWYTARLAVFFVLTLPFAGSLLAQHGGGGHSGGGHFSGGSSGHSAGHAIGHSFGRMFGHHGGHGKGPSGQGEEPPLAGAAIVKGRVAQLSGPISVLDPRRPGLRHQTVGEIPVHQRFRFFPFRRGFAGCAGFTDFGLPRRHFFFDEDFGCFSSGFFFDPFFFGGFSQSFASNSGFMSPAGSAILPDGALTEETASSDEESSFAADFGRSADKNSRIVQREDLPITTDEHPATLLVLQDGSMFGLTDYWLDGNRLGYVTDYGAQNSVAIESVDFAKTFRANQERGIQFAPRLKPPAR